MDVVGNGISTPGNIYYDVNSNAGFQRVYCSPAASQLRPERHR